MRRAQHEWSRLAMCEGKSPLTWAQARSILDRQGIRWARKGRWKSAYHCPICRAWHIGRRIRIKRR